MDIRGKIFGDLAVIKRSHICDGHAFWVCKCICGKEAIIPINNLLSGNTKSCGCKRRTHGMKGTKEYRSWQGMKDRCSNPKTLNSSYYLGKGIKVCERWKDSFENFFEDMGYAPSKIHSLDRYPNRHGNYEPTNCRWATKKQQTDNRDYCVMISYNGETMNMLDWSKKLGIHRRAFDYARSHKKSLEGVIAKRLDKNYNDEEWSFPKQYDKSKGLHLDYKGTSMSLATWARVLGMPYWDLLRKIKYRGETIEQIINDNRINKIE